MKSHPDKSSPTQKSGNDQTWLLLSNRGWMQTVKENFLKMVPQKLSAEDFHFPEWKQVLVVIHQFLLLVPTESSLKNSQL